MKDLLVFPLIIVSQFVCSFLVNWMGYDTLESFRHAMRARGWERGGQIYKKLFLIHRWKDLVPELGAISPEGFRKRRLASQEPGYLNQFILESIRAELCHFFSLVLAVPILAFFSSRFTWWAVVYIVILNVPCIMIQRTNRPRLERLLRHSLASAACREAEAARSEQGI